MTSLRGDALRTLEAYPPSDLRQRFLDLFVDRHDPTGHDPTRRDTPGAHITASALIVHADLKRVLLCLHGRIRRWVQVGGHCEDGDETLAGAALREATEESGIAGLWIHPEAIDLDVHPVQCRYGPSQHYDVRFAALAPPGAVEVVSAESYELGWFPADALPTPLASATERLVAPALAVARRLAGYRVTPGPVALCHRHGPRTQDAGPGERR